MKYVVIDIETTGLDPAQDQILEFAAIIEDGHSPIEALSRFQRVIKHRRICGDIKALVMNSDLLKAIAGGEVASCLPGDLGIEFAEFLATYGWDGNKPLVCAGKNFAGFDRQFLERLPHFPKIHYRSLDPGSLYYDYRIDSEVPNLSTCLRQAGLPETISHIAIEDALQVVKLLRKGLPCFQRPNSI